MSFDRKELSKNVTGKRRGGCPARNGKVRLFAKQIIKKILDLVSTVAVFSLPLAIAISADQSDRTIINPTMHEIVIDTDCEEVVLPVLYLSGTDSIRPKLRILSPFDAPYPRTPDAFAVKICYIDIVDLPEQQYHILIPERLRD